MPAPVSNCRKFAYAKVMDLFARLSLFSLPDAIGFCLIITLWFLTGYLTENPPKSRLSARTPSEPIRFPRDGCWT